MKNKKEKNENDLTNDLKNQKEVFDHDFSDIESLKQNRKTNIQDNERLGQSLAPRIPDDRL
jgi:hypothetical protein